MPKKDEQLTPLKNAVANQPRAEEFFSAVIAQDTKEQDTKERGQNTLPKNDDSASKQPDDQWLTDNFEGQLAVDVYQTDENVVIQSTLAGVRVEDIDIAVNNDMVTIRGLRRREHEVKPEDYFYQECYWGGFSRSIILPFDVKSEKVIATLKNGILTITLPKADRPRVRNVRVKEEIEDETGG